MTWVKLEVPWSDADRVYRELTSTFTRLFAKSKATPMHRAAALYMKDERARATFYLSPEAARLLNDRTSYEFEACEHPPVSVYDMLVGDSSASEVD